MWSSHLIWECKNLSFSYDACDVIGYLFSRHRSCSHRCRRSTVQQGVTREWCNFGFLAELTLPSPGDAIGSTGRELTRMLGAHSCTRTVPCQGETPSSHFNQVENRFPCTTRITCFWTTKWKVHFIKGQRLSTQGIYSLKFTDVHTVKIKI